MQAPEPDRRHAIGILVLGLSVPLLIWQADPANQLDIAPAHFLAAHAMMEVFAIVVAALVFSTGYGRMETERSTRTVVLGCAFLAVAVFDTLHFLSYAGMPDVISPNSAHKSILFWLLGRYAAAAGLLAYVLLSDKAPTRAMPGRRTCILVALPLIAALSWLLLKAPETVPSMYRVDAGLTSLKIALEWIVFGLCLGTAALLAVRRRQVTHCDFGSLMLALLLMAVSEVFVTVYVQVTSTANLLGHAYKVFAYYFLYRAIHAEAVREPFRRMREMLTHDDLTGLLNRSAFGEQLQQSLMPARAAGASRAVLLLGLDHFQNVNGTLGHEQGDTLLIAVAGRLRSALPPDAVVARFSGDVFAIRMDGAPPRRVEETGRTLLRVIAGEFGLGKDRFGITASIGVATYPTDGTSASVLTRHADLALHQAKRAGRNCMIAFSNELDEKIHRHVLLEANLKQALARQELHLHYQPKWEIGSGRLTGWEALLRWQSPQLGEVRPDEFIPLAEQSGLILPIGEWVLHEACRQLHAWRSAGLDPGTMAVNLSARQVRQSGFVQDVHATLHRTGVAPAELELEITESILMDNLQSTLGMLAELNRLGVRIAIDDFGTGYSSLSYLKNFAIHCLKIDQSFIRDIPDEDDTAIVRTIITLAQTLGLTVVAEGVETPEQLGYLRANGCDQAQGYLFSRPLPPEACEALLHAELSRSAPHGASARAN